MPGHGSLQTPLLFLDIDGVANSGDFAIQENRKWNAGDKTANGSGLDPRACSTILFIQEQVPDVRIVLSSCWRIGRTLEEARIDLAPLLLRPEMLIGMTPVIHEAERGEEIAAWLKCSPYPDPIFVILDDSSDMGELTSHLVQTDDRVGITLIHAERVIQLLQGQIPEKGISPSLYADEFEGHLKWEFRESAQVKRVATRLSENAASITRRWRDAQ